MKDQHHYDGNPVGLPENVAREVARDLDRHLASFITLFHQYHKHHWLVEGPQFRDLHLFFEENYTQVHAQFDQIAERMTVLGLTPTCHPENVARLSYVNHEPEGAFRIRECLENDLRAEQAVVAELRLTIRKAIDFQDYATKNLLEGILYKAEDRAHHIHHFLGQDSVLMPDLDLMED